MKNKIRFLTTGILFIVLVQNPIPSQIHHQVLEQFSVDSQMDQSIRGWEEKSFVGNTIYRIIEEDGNYILHARADSSCSGLYKQNRFNPKEWQVLSWRWKVIRLPDKGDERFKETDDYGARVYVVFPQILWWRSRTISYIWAQHLPKNAFCQNPWMPKYEMMLAVESGADSLGRWTMERRNVYEDYIRLFGTEPPRAGAIAVLTDSDNTGGSAEAFYDDFILWTE
jgi:hypothetical protein